MIRRCLRCAVSALLLLGAATGQAQDYPSAPIRIVVPFGPGAVQDTIARTFNNELGQTLFERKARDLSMASKFSTEWSFLTDLRARGRKAADAWLAAHLDQVGVASTVDLRAEFL